MNQLSSRTQNVLIILAVCAAVLVFRWPSIKERIWGSQIPEPAFTWEHHWPEAESLAKEQNKAMLVVFSASWCPPCKMMKREVWPDPRVGQAVTAGYVPLYVDVDLDEHAPKVAQYKINGIPFVVILNPDGTVRRQSHTMSAEETLQFLTEN